ncbi:glycosyltransferase family 4 protein [Pelagicoccus mobilis]|uniref:Glycosyltransferase family 4 protein n=1 Tax=Pelagicoccus mobilis TaxID=415221 RepID=A0A934S053_9BACT|nr:glycosyltransferase family 1 protein [Pelagicoccus mobilis]MBK1879493.1 glycosyltransferase family 4 protein [Pelagicoccus mobilis]
MAAKVSMNQQASRPLKVAYDIARLTAGGANGGIKVHHYEFLRCFAEHFSDQLQLHIFCLEEIVPELDFLTLGGNHQIHILGSRAAFEPRDFEKNLPPLHYWPEPPENLLSLLGIDVLYAGFGFSQLYTPDVPQVSLIVDVLHRVYPESLPPEEVAFRDKWYAEELEKATLVQTNSEYCKQQLIDEFGADPDKIFVIGVPVHGRFNRVEMGQLPLEIAHIPHKYFLYPANYWPHKNHKRLIEAYALYEKEAGEDALHLVLTGDMNDLGQARAKQIEELGLTHKIHQIGHQDMPTYKALWELCHSLVFPSLYEGFGIPILEAMHFQKPTALSNSQCLTQVASPESLNLETADKSELAGTLLKLHSEAEGYRGETNALERFTLPQEAKNWIHRIKEAANRCRKGVARSV